MTKAKERAEMVTELSRLAQGASKWPTHVAVARAADICRDEEENAEGQHCLLGLARHSFKGSSQAAWDAAQMAIEIEISEAADMWPGNVCIPSFNDNVKNPKRLVAAIWNRAMKRPRNTPESRLS